MYQPMIVGIGGSTGATSATTRLLRRCLEHTQRMGARTAAITAAELASAADLLGRATLLGDAPVRRRDRARPTASSSRRPDITAACPGW